jgi:hypothetical protein
MKINFMEIKKTKEVLICDCHSSDHQILLMYSEDEYSSGETFPMCYAHIHLNRRPFWERVKYGIKYIFGYKCRYGAFDEFMFNPDDVEKLEKLVKYLKNEQNG